jgi:hypothetical protein
MKISANPTAVRTDIPVAATPGTEAPAASNLGSRRPGYGAHLANNNALDVMANIFAKGVFGFVNMYRGTKIPIPDLHKQPGMLGLLSRMDKKQMDDALTIMSGLSHDDVSGFISAFKLGLNNIAEHQAYLNGHRVNRVSNLLDALGSAAVGIFSSAIFYKESPATVASDRLLNMAKSVFKNPKVAAAIPHPAKLFTLFLGMQMSKIASRYSQGYEFQKSGETKTHAEKNHDMFAPFLIGALCTVGVFIESPNIKEKFADLLFGPVQSKGFYDGCPDIEALNPGAGFLETMKKKSESAYQRFKAGPQYHSIRNEAAKYAFFYIPAALIVFSLYGLQNNKVGNESYLTNHPRVKTEDSHGK